MISGPHIITQEPMGEAENRESGDGKTEQAFGETTQNLSQQLKSQILYLLSGQKKRITRQMEGIAQALKHSSKQMHEQQNDSAARITEAGAQSIDRLAHRLRHSDPNALAREIKDFARRRPAVVGGIALAAGFIIGQLLSDYGKQGAPRTDVAGEATGTSLEYHPAEDEEGYYERH